MTIDNPEQQESGPAIRSARNARLKEIRRLARRRTRERTGRFVAEGEDLLAAADAAGWPAVERYCAADSGLPGVEVDPDVLRAVSALGSGTRTLAVYEQRWASPAGPLAVALWGVGDPGNVGTVVRAAAAFGAGCVALAPGCADPYGPRAVRASMGAVFAVPLARVEAVEQLSGTRVALVAGEGPPLHELATTLAPERVSNPSGSGRRSRHSAVSVVVGAEREGLPAAVVAACDRVAHIPIGTDSLNAAMAATVALYELDRRMAAR